MTDTQLSTKKHIEKKINKGVSLLQTCVQKSNQHLLNFFVQNGYLQEFLRKDLSDVERQEIVNNWQFMHEQIMSQLQKNYNLQDYLLVVIHIKNYLNVIAPFVQENKQAAFVEYGLKLLSFQVKFFEQLQAAQEQQSYFSEYIHSLPNHEGVEPIKNQYQNMSIVARILETELAMLR